MARITLKGNPFRTNGDLPAVGATAPDFTLVNGDMQAVSLVDFAGKRKVLSTVPSLDTAVCAASTRQFNERATSMDDTVVLVVSADLPMAQKRFCETEGIENVVPLSMVRSKRFAKDYGVLVQDGPLEGFCARSVIVLDADNKVVHCQLVEEVAEEPDYDAALAVLA